jgi:DNA-binding MarR family transcriptional regulator
MDDLRWTDLLPDREAESPDPIQAEAEPQKRAVYQAAASRVRMTRVLRHQFLNSAWLGEPVWDIVLVLYVCDGRRRMTTGDVIALSAVPSSTALRWFAVLEDAGLIVRNDSPTDKRVVYIELSDLGRAKLDTFFAQVQRTFYAPPSSH